MPPGIKDYETVDKKKKRVLRVDGFHWLVTIVRLCFYLSVVALALVVGF
jgi:hypothetical protein